VARSAFVGRADEVDRLTRLVRGDADGAAVVLVTGDAGMGKTRLLEEVRSRSTRVTVLNGSCLPLSESLPYGALADALAALIGPEGRPLLDKALSRCAPFVLPQLTALLPALHAGRPEPPGAATPNRTALFSAVRDLLAALGADRRTVLVVDDLHWADTGSLDLLTFLARRVPPDVMVLMSSRRGELSPEDRILAWQETILRDTDREHLALGPLPDADVASMVTSLAGPAADPALITDVLRRGGGNPFFTEQLVASADDRRRRSDPPQVPETVAHMLLTRVRALSAPATEVASVLAVAARPLAEPELEACVVDAAEAATAVGDLLDARLVESAGNDSYRLRHALLEDTVRETLLPSRRAVLHARVAEVLSARGSEAPGEIAAHWGRAGRFVEEARWSQLAARRAETVFAWREASASWRRVWDLWDELTEDDRPPVTLADVIIGCVEALWRSGDDDAFAEVIERARGEERVRADDWAQARLLSVHAPFLGAWDKEEEIALRAQAADHYARTGRPSGEQADNLYRLAYVRLREGREVGSEHEDRLEAVRIAEAAGSLAAQVSVGSNLAADMVEQGDVDGGVTRLEALLRLAQRGTDRAAVSAELWTSVMLTDAHLWLLRIPAVVAVGRAGIERAVAHGLSESFASSILVSNLVEGLVLSGDVPAARDLLEPYSESSLIQRRWPTRLAQADLDVLGGHLSEVIALIHEVRTEGLDSSELHLYLDELESAAHLWSGHARLAWDVALGGLDGMRADREGNRAGLLLAQAARAAADLAEEGVVDPAELTDRLLGRAEVTGCLVPHPSRVLGAAYATTFAGELARLSRDGEEEAWRAARDTWAGHGVPHHTAYAGWRLAEVLLDAGRRVEAEQLVAEGHGLAEGHVPLLNEIEGLARRARLQRPAPWVAETSEKAATTRPYGLTERELDVLRLLATGATNGEIGRRLYMSPKTASVHVTAILRKLGVRGRVQAATVAERVGLLEEGPRP
jgi:DNA-binding CsgD family transcriptional regulator